MLYFLHPNLNFLRFSFIHARQYITVLVFYLFSPARRTGVQVELIHEIDVCSVVGLVLKIYNCWKNSGRKIVVVD
jgi:hypothetical protein